MTVIPFKYSVMHAGRSPGPNTGIIKCKTNDSSYFFLLPLHGAVVRLSQQGVKEDGLAIDCIQFEITLFMYMMKQGLAFYTLTLKKWFYIKTTFTGQTNL
jgi:hypothetical protein